jgi:hypothetical protein
VVTYAQLQTEQWWGREIVTPELKTFEAWIRERFGLSALAVGDKGNSAHLNGSHRSQEWIERSRFCTNRTYTVQPGLTADQKRHIAGVDITPRTRTDMLAMSQRIDRATRAGQLEEVVAWYGNTNDDQRVDGYDNIRNALATSDASHLWHLHLSLDRRILRDLTAMRRVYATLAGTTPPPAATEDDMQLTDAFTIPNYDADPGLPAVENTSVKVALGVASQRSWQAMRNTKVLIDLVKKLGEQSGIDAAELEQVEAAARQGAAEAFAEQRAQLVTDIVAALPQDRDGNLSVTDVESAVRSVFADAGSD